MVYFKLPKTTSVKRVIPKNAFDSFTNTKQKKIFIDKVQRITWSNKLSKETVNLEGKEIKEIQVFKIEVKEKFEIQEVLDIIDKAIPYPILFIVEFEDSIYLSTSVKHPHVTNENLSIIDWNFKTDWFIYSEVKYSVNLKGNLDDVFKDFCVQISDNPEMLLKPLSVIVKNQQEIKTLKNEIERLKSKIAKKGQFNERLEFNLMLKAKEKELVKLLES